MSLEQEQPGKPARPPEPVPEPEARDDVRILAGTSGELRCPFCHTAVRPGLDLTIACDGCGARHHRTCWGEHKRCASCGCARGSTPVRPGPGRPSRRAELASRLGVSALVLITAAAAIGLVHRWRNPPLPPPPVQSGPNEVKTTEPVQESDTFKKPPERSRKREPEPSLAPSPTIQRKPDAQGLYASDWFGKGVRAEMSGALEEAIVDYTRALELDPTSPDPWQARGDIHFRRDAFPQAITDYDRAIELAPRRAALWVNRGIARARSKDPGARADLDHALELVPTHVNCLYYRADVRENSGDLVGALADIQRAIEIEPSAAYLWFRLGTFQSSHSRSEEALAALNKALELDPKLANAWHWRGYVRSKAGDHPGAVADFTRVLELTKRPLTSEASGLFASRAYSEEQLGNDLSAVTDLLRAVELETGDLRAKASLARVGNRALVEATKVLEGSAAPDASAWARRAAIRRGCGDLEGAASDAARAIELDPRCALAWWARGSVADLEKAVTLAPGNTDWSDDLARARERSRGVPAR